MGVWYSIKLYFPSFYWSWWWCFYLFRFFMRSCCSWYHYECRYPNNFNDCFRSSCWYLFLHYNSRRYIHKRSWNWKLLDNCWHMTYLDCLGRAKPLCRTNWIQLCSYIMYRPRWRRLSNLDCLKFRLEHYYNSLAYIFSWSIHRSTHSHWNFYYRSCMYRLSRNSWYKNIYNNSWNK